MFLTDLPTVLVATNLPLQMAGAGRCFWPVATLVACAFLVKAPPAASFLQPGHRAGLAAVPARATGAAWCRRVGLACTTQKRAYVNADMQQPGRADGAANAPNPTQCDGKAADTANVGVRRRALFISTLYQ